MKVGDLVYFRGSVGIVLDTGTYTYDRDVLVKWNDEAYPMPENSVMLKRHCLVVINESR